MDKLTTKPEQYITITNADPILLRAIANLGKSVEFNSLDETQLDELLHYHKTPNIEYQKSYYRVGIITGDPLAIYGQIMLLCFIIFIIALVTLISLLAIKGLKRKELV